MRTIIERQPFKPKNHDLLKKLWVHTFYENYHNEKGTDPNSVARLRLRERHPLPRTIWDGEATSYGLKV